MGLLRISMDINSKEEFIYFMQRACEDQSNDCYIELYNILLRAFVCADCDFDGQVSEDEFGGMINAAAALPKKFGPRSCQGLISDFQLDTNSHSSRSSADDARGFPCVVFQIQLMLHQIEDHTLIFIKSCPTKSMFLDSASD